jgi:antitoxin VapB
METDISARLFWSGHSQALRLPKEFRFDGDEVRLVRMGTGILVTPIQKRKKKNALCDDYFAQKSVIDDDFMATRPLNQIAKSERIF